MTAYREAWIAYTNTAYFRTSVDTSTLGSDAKVRKSLQENRLHEAFDAGWNAALDLASAKAMKVVEGTK